MASALIAVGAILLLVAAAAGVYGRRQHRRRALVEATETTAVRDIREEGRVELKGTVRSDSTFDAPIRGDPAVLSAWEVEEWDEGGSSDMWETRAEGVYATPFTLDDGTGNVTIDIGTHVDDTSTGTGIDDIQVSAIDVDRFLSTGVTVGDVIAALDDFGVELTVPPDTEPPERITEFVRGETSVATQADSITNVIDIGNAHGERRYYEGTLSPGDDVYVLGHARASETATHPLKPEDVVVEPIDGETFIVSDKPEDELVETFGRYTYAYAIAAALALAGIAAIAYGAGVV
ncbi:E3 ubiquitin ligase family protein [Salarchaeum japonicum]|uniref:RING-type E3 ubiquitin transferase n=1 Tax=Salarchaeum japonicum TaxID=555573 RepID=A0AAV3T1K6_9EURY|nr:E3 ubiquitin ligase family protein [Salarchaeum japonicum]